MGQSILSSADLRSLLELVGSAPPAPNPDRRPRWNEREKLVTRQVRHLVQIGQGVVFLKAADGRAFQLPLLWLERWGGTFGTASSAAANARRGGQGEFERAPASEPTDRGGSPAWLLYFSCPKCSKRCRVLYTPFGEADHSCPKCTKLTPQGRCGPTTGRKNAHPRNKRQRFLLQHQLAAERIRRDYLQHTGPAYGPRLLAPLAIPKPPRMTWHRYKALCRLVEAHDLLAMEMQVHQLQLTLARLVPTAKAPPEHRPSKWAQAILAIDAWATRQTSWHRRGKPRDTPGEGTREKLARMGSSTDGSGHAENS